MRSNTMAAVLLVIAAATLPDQAQGQTQVVPGGNSVQQQSDIESSSQALTPTLSRPFSLMGFAVAWTGTALTPGTPARMPAEFFARMAGDRRWGISR
jgi:hypothetical protein